MIGEARQARSYLIAMGIAVVGLLAAIPTMNVMMDPLGYARVAGWRPANPTEEERSRAARGTWPVPDGTREAKMLNVAYYAPQVLVFGSSTVFGYVDVEYPPLRGTDGRPAFNFGLGGASIREVLTAFEHAVALKPPKRVVIGLEFYMFSADKPTSPGFLDLPLAQRSTYRLDRARYLRRRLFSADYSYAALAMMGGPLVERVASLLTRRAQAAALEPPAGAGPAGRISRSQFLQLMLEADRVIIAGLYPHAGQPFRLQDDNGWSSLDAIRRIVAIARAHDTDLRLYISPNHARSYEAIRLMGWWPQFEAWERGLATIVEEDAQAHPGQPAIPIWDFAGYTSVTTDPVAVSPTSSAAFTLYVDSIHFNTDVGNMVIDRLYSTASAQRLPRDFGVLLTRDTIEDHLASMRQRQRAYTAANRDDIADLALMLGSLGRLEGAAP